MTEISYETIILECHQLLDSVGIPGAQGSTCDDPLCQSLLVHRIKHVLIPELKLMRLKDKLSLSNNLCPDHRDKQSGKPCLACEVEALQRKLTTHRN